MANMEQSPVRRSPRFSKALEIFEGKSGSRKEQRGEVNEKADLSIRKGKRKLYVEGSDDDFVVAKVATREEAKNVNSRNFKTRMSPSILKKLVLDFSDAQRKDVEDIGFGGFLHVKTGSLPKLLPVWLLENFDPLMCSLVVGDKQLAIGEDDVRACFGFPKCDTLVEEATRKDVKDFKVQIDSWKSQWGNNVEVTTTMLGNKLREQVDGGALFKKNFVVFIVSTLLKGTQNGNCNYRILKALGDVEAIKSLNWCEYTLRSLASTSMNWKRKRNSTFTGPIFFLLLCYLDRFLFINRIAPRKVPIISSWTKEKITLRVTEELKHGGFGKGRVVGLAEIDEVAIKVKSQGNQQKAAKDDETSKKKVVLDRMVAAAKAFSSSYEEFVDSVKEAGEHFPGCEIIEKMKSLATAMLNIKVDMPGSAEKSPNEASKGKTSQSPYDEDLFDCPGFIEVADELIRKFMKKKSKADYGPNFNLLTPTTSGDECKSPFVVADVGNADGPSIPVAADVGNAVSPSIPDIAIPSPTVQECTPTENIASPDVQVDQHNDIDLDINVSAFDSDVADDTHVNVPVPSTVHPSMVHVPSVFLDGSPSRKRKEHQVSYQVERRVSSTREISLPAVYKSPFWSRHMKSLKFVSKMEKTISNWVFSNLQNDKERSEIVWNDGCYTLCRGALHSLASTKSLSIIVVDFWSYFCNYRERFRGSASPKRLFVYLNISMNTADYDTFAKLLDDQLANTKYTDVVNADLICFPIYSDEVQGYYYMICLNLIKGRMQVIDVMDSSVFGMNEGYDKVATELAGYMSYYLHDKRSGADMIPFYYIEVVKMPWQTKKDVIKDSGIYLMRFMESFYGDSKHWDVGFKSITDATPHRLRVKYSNLIISSEANLLKDTIVELAEELANPERS